jgi:uncharacterized protein (DUF433 family)
MHHQLVRYHLQGWRFWLRQPRGRVDVATVETRYEHIVLWDGKGPVIDGTRLRVIDLVAAQQAYGYRPEDLAYEYPFLTFGQIYSALAYYWDHKQELDEDMARRLAFVDELRARTPEPPALARLRALKAERLRSLQKD